MNEKLDVVTKTVQRHCDRVDEKRHIVGDDLNDRCVRVPAVPIDRGVEDPNDGNAATAVSTRRDMIQGRRSQCLRIAITQIFLGHVGEVGPEESGPAAWQSRACSSTAGAADDRVEEIATTNWRSLTDSGPRVPIRYAG